MSTKTLDAVLVATIQGVVDQKIADCELFTAFDVSRAVQHLGHRERHDNMKHVVHEYFRQGNFTGYDRTLGAVDPGKPEAWIYHPMSVPSTKYQPIHQALPSGMTAKNFYKTPAAVAAPDPVPVGNSFSSITFSPPKSKSVRPLKGTHTPDARGALTVPATMIRQIGASHKDVLYVSQTANALVISRTGPGWNYNVNSSCNIRIKRKRLSLIPCKGKWNFRQDNGMIVVENV